MISAAQLRAARGLLDWSRSDLSKASGISPETIKNIEHGTFRPQETTADAIVRAFASHGVEFTDNNGIRQVADAVIRLEGAEGFKRFLDSVYDVARSPETSATEEKPICISNVNEELFAQYLGDYLAKHIARMNEIKNMKIKVLVRNDTGSDNASDSRGSLYRECRQVCGEQSGNVPFYVYGDNLAILIFDDKKALQIVIISSSLVAKAYREQFEIMWSSAKTVTAI
jgi:DNA-binding XRE family transcriptional regulator